MTDDEIIEVVTAHKEGKQIQGSALNQSNVWLDLVEPVCWNFKERVYRVKPEPRKPREWTLAVCTTSNGIYGMATEYNVNAIKNIETVRVREVIEDRECNCGFPDLGHWPYCNSLKND